MAETLSCNAVPAGAWETFNNSAETEVSPISTLDCRLEEVPQCSIEELLDEEDVIQEFRAGNSQLVERMCTPDAVRTLVEHITRELSGGVSQGCPSRRPFVAAELLACNAERLFEVFVQPGNVELLNLLFSFMDSLSRDVTPPALASYFCSTVTTLSTQYPDEIAAYLRQRCPDELIDGLLEHLELRCFAELLVHFLSAEAPGHVVFQNNQLVWKLVNCIDEKRFSSAAHEHIAFILDHLLARTCVGDLCQGSDFLRQCSAAPVLAALVSKVRSDCPAAAAAAAVLASAVLHIHGVPCHPLLPTRTSDAQALRAARPQIAGETDQQRRGASHVSCEGEAEAIAVELEAAGATVVDRLCAEMPRLCSVIEAAARAHTLNASAERLEASRAILHEAIVLLLRANESSCDPPLTTAMAKLDDLSATLGADELRSVLMRHGWAVAESRCEGPKSTPQEVLADLRQASQARRRDAVTVLPQFGKLALEVLCLLAILVKTGRAIVFESMLKAHVLPLCLEMMLSRPTSSVLHNAVRAIFSEVVGDPEQGLELVLALLRSGPLMHRFVAEYRCSVDSQASDGSAGVARGRMQVGYMGHVRCMCMELQQLGTTSTEIATALADIPDWLDIVQSDMEATAKLQAEPLGGQHPEAGNQSYLPSFDCFMAARGAMADLSDEIDLSLEDLRDIHEDLDEQQILDLAEVQHRRRTKALTAAEATTESQAEAAKTTRSGDPPCVTLRHQQDKH